ncbi:MAG: porin family protein [Dysgonomonas sp.]|nr:porin family protein [Dysgonomonas sp.]
MKNFIKAGLVAVAMLFCVSVSAQISFGVKAGVNLSNYGGDVDDNKAKAGFNAGVTAEIGLPLTNLYVLSGLEYTTKGAKYDGNNYSYNSNANFLQLPVHVGYRVSALETLGVSFHAGPYFAYGIGGKTGKGEAKNDTFDDGMLKKFDFGLGAGVGLELGKIGVGLGYDFGLANLYDGEGNDKVRTMNAYLSVGYKF